MSATTKHFSELSKKDVQEAGGKGASLGEMTQAGIPVPPGFVVLSSVFDDFLKETDLNIEIEAILQTVEHQMVHTVEEASKNITALILHAEMPSPIKTSVLSAFDQLGAEFVAVRSSATSEDSADAAWAGQLESFLNTKRDDVLKMIQKCWASLFTPRAIFYRFEQGLQEKEISVAVVVQKMVDSDSSGVAFSVHPITEDPNQLIIEGSYGLGEAIVSGQVTPDSYVVRKEPESILDKNVYVQPRGLFRSPDGETVWKEIPQKLAVRQVLTDRQILALSKIILKIESHYGFPCDIEWALKGKNFYITQSRPITTLQDSSSTQKTQIDLHEFTKENHTFFWHLQGVPYISHEQWARGTSGINFVVMSQGENAYCYLSNEQVSRCLQEGLEMIQDKKRTKQHLKLFTQLIKEVKTFGKNVCTKKITESLWKDFDVLLVRIWEMYKHTEWFYTDRYYEENVSVRLRKKMEDMKQLARETSNNFHLEKDGPYDCLVTWAAHHLKADLSLITSSSCAEINQAFETGVLEDHRNRIEGFGILYQDGIRTELDAKTARTLLKQLRDIVPNPNQTVIKGTTARGGFVHGIASVIPMTYDDLEKMQQLMSEVPEGNILIASTTSPEFTPVFKKVSGIVTNEGGLGSHAAIVSRELGIPCVVGTGNAADIIKDGMEIEIDADEGVVRIIK